MVPTSNRAVHLFGERWTARVHRSDLPKSTEGLRAPAAKGKLRGECDGMRCLVKFNAIPKPFLISACVVYRNR